MVFHLVGLGLADEKDITVKGLEVVRRCKTVYLEAYTAILMVPPEKLVSLRNTMVRLVKIFKKKWPSGLGLGLGSRLSK